MTRSGDCLLRRTAGRHHIKRIGCGSQEAALRFQFFWVFVDVEAVGVVREEVADVPALLGG